MSGEQFVDLELADERSTLLALKELCLEEAALLRKNIIDLELSKDTFGRALLLGNLAVRRQFKNSSEKDLVYTRGKICGYPVFETVPFDVDTLRTTSSGPRQQWNAHIWNNDLTLHEFNITDSGSTPTKKEHTIYVANNKINSLEINRHSDFYA